MQMESFNRILSESWDLGIPERKSQDYRILKQTDSSTANGVLECYRLRGFTDKNKGNLKRSFLPIPFYQNKNYCARSYDPGRLALTSYY